MGLLFHESQKTLLVNNRYVLENSGVCPEGTPPGYCVAGTRGKIEG
jgi:hypothetical protein